MKIIIGSAKFGFKYGLNKKKITKLEINLIEKILKKNSLQKFDTAMSYGESEKIIGNFNIKKKVITKIKLPKKKPKNLKFWFKKKLENSLKKLKSKYIYGLLIHDTSDILGKNRDFLNILLDYKKKNFISKLGVSVYEIGEIKKILKFWKPDIIQIPLNVFDQRFLKNDFLKKIKRSGIEIHARSCFLQGILLNSMLNIGNNKSVELNRFIKIIEELVGKKANKKFLEMQPGDVYETYADIDQIKKEFNFSPKTDINEGLKKFVDWYKNYYK